VLAWLVAAVEPAPRPGLQHLERLAQAHPGAAAHVVDAAGGAVRGGGGARGGDHVGDVGEVARLAAVAEDLDRVAGEPRATEPVEGHVRPLTRAVDGEVPERDGRERLEQLLGAVVEPIFTPPWNRCTAETGRCLVDLGVETLPREAIAEIAAAAVERGGPLGGCVRMRVLAAGSA
jgi:hypothetical protein